MTWCVVLCGLNSSYSLWQVQPNWNLPAELHFFTDCQTEKANIKIPEISFGKKIHQDITVIIFMPSCLNSNFVDLLDRFPIWCLDVSRIEVHKKGLKTREIPQCYQVTSCYIWTILLLVLTLSNASLDHYIKIEPEINRPDLRLWDVPGNYHSYCPSKLNLQTQFKCKSAQWGRNFTRQNYNSFDVSGELLNPSVGRVSQFDWSCPHQRQLCNLKYLLK